MPALEAELQQGAGRADVGRVDLVWLGRASIPGIEPGTTVVAEGRLGVRRGRATMFNPRYELRLAGTDGPSVPGVPGVSPGPEFRAAS
jgi:hypothetical protein